MNKVATTLFALIATAGTAVADAPVSEHVEQNREDAIRTSMSLHSVCDGDLSEQQTAFECFRSSAWEMYDFAATTKNKIRNSGLPEGVVFPASHTIEYGCIRPFRELSQTQIEFAGIADIRDRIVDVINGCDSAMREAETLSNRVIGDFSLVFNYDALNALSSHTEWLEGIRPELLEANLN